MSACSAGSAICRDSSTITANMHVLPVPDFACTMRSAPNFPRGIARACTGEGLTYPARVTARIVLDEGAWSPCPVPFAAAGSKP